MSANVHRVNRQQDMDKCRKRRKTHEMVNHSDKEVEEQWRTTCLHLHLHCPATLEGVATTDNESKVMCPQLGVRGRSIGVSETSGRQDGATLHTGL